jgi:bifunctional non-homologous end joining protein LigD
VAKKKSDRDLDEYRRKRDFSRTPEPAGDGPAGTASGLRFVIQKHAASHLHYDLRLEMEGVMRSWAVPKGPSLDPAVKRLAMEVEDHPIEYNDFEGIIPAGEYGGGTVMLWDHGTYEPDDSRKGEGPEEGAVRGYREGKLSFTLHGERLSGSFALVRTESVEDGVRSKWLFFKHRDETAAPGSDVTTEVTTSVVSQRSMDEIAEGKGRKRVWRSNRSRPAFDPASGAGPPLDHSSLRPMLASSGEQPSGGDWVYEPKYDGIRVLAFATADAVALITRNGHDKARQFPEVVAALHELVGALEAPVVVDGEIVALDGGRVGRFEGLQGRIHTRDERRIEKESSAQPAAFVAFDILLVGDEVQLSAPWRERRAVLESVLDERTSTTLRLSETATDRRSLLRRGQREGWEGIVAKRPKSLYRPSQRSPDWIKIKLENRQEFVVGGWTDPRGSRSLLGAILLGYYDDAGRFVYAGHTGAGFDRDSLREMHRRLKPLERKTSPFETRPRTNEPAHWTTPRVVVEVKFNEWTRDGKLRQPVFLGLRDDKDAAEVVREETPETPKGNENDHPPRSAASPPSSPSAGALAPEDDSPAVRRLRSMAAGEGGGELKLGKSGSIPITSLGKVFYPQTGHTKVDLLVYYAAVADHILPWMKDRPLVLKRFPNGVEGESFYQQAAPETVPPGVRVETLEIEGREQRRLIGGSLATLLYTIQLGAISYDPWHSRITDLQSADYTILDLDPGDGADFRRVLDVARWVKEEMDALGLHGAIKTSGSRGLHIYLPLPPGTPLDAATLLAQIVATRVAQQHPKHATVERMTKKRPRGTVYVDYLQNILGKTVAGVYAARARPEPTVSTPLAWEELTPELDLRALTIDSVPARIREAGDLWNPAMARPNSLERMRSAD